MKKIISVISNQYLWLFLIIGLAFVLRLYRIDSPIADWHSWRQADTAAVSRSFFKEGFNPFISKYDDMISVSEGLIVNPNRYRFVEFPIYNTIVYWGYLVNGSVDERIARFVSVLFACGSIIWLFLLTRKYFDKWTALLSGFVFAILPFAVYYGRVILPEPSLVFFCLGMVYFVDRWIFENKWWLYIMSFVFIMCSFLVKPMAVFYLVPLIYSFWKKEGRWWPIPKRYFGLFIPAVLPFVAWRVWMQNFPEGIPMSNWLLNGNGIRFRPAFWYWIVGERIGGVILGPVGTGLLLIGAFLKASKGYFLHFLFLGMLIYLVTFATGNVHHDYYQYLILPALCIFVGRGVVELVRLKHVFISKVILVPMVVFMFGLTIYLPFTKVIGYYQINDGAIVDAGRMADKILPKDAVVVAQYMGDSSFLYQTNRVGWAILAEGMEDMKRKYNVGFYITTARDSQAVDLMKSYTVMVDDPKYIIIDVRGNPK
jgi:4-amino-4-deoxy-L-arabinose transferase-like glycosyltransferase